MDFYSIENFIVIWEAYSKVIKSSTNSANSEYELDNISSTSLPICFAFPDWAKFRTWLDERSLILALGLSFYFSRVLSRLNNNLKWTANIEDESRSFMGKNHPVMMSKTKKSSPVDIVMRWSLQHLRQDEYFKSNKVLVISEAFKRVQK